MNSIISCFGWWKWSLELEWRRMVDSDLPPSPNDFLFPPIDHENLQIASQTPPSPPSPQPFDSRLRGWISISFHILRSKLSSLMQRGPIWSIGLPSAALLMSCWIFISIRKKITLTPNEARLVNIIKDKDRKIAKLLHQIAQMNEILIDRHKALVAKAAAAEWFPKACEYGSSHSQGTVVGASPCLHQWSLMLLLSSFYFWNTTAYMCIL